MKKICNKEAQKLELDILLQFKFFCEKYRLRYFLAYGTLIGAVRHQGFIPWDNDIDILMPRPDYEKLIERCKQGETIADHLSLIDYREKKAFPFLKLVDNRTSMKEHFLDTDSNMGIYIDIFPLDGMPDTSKIRMALYKRAAILYKLYAFANYRKNTGANWYKKLIKKILYPFSRLVSSDWVNKKLNEICKKYDYDNSEYVGDIVWGYEPEREIMPRNYFDTAKLVFEGYEFCVPAEYDKLLTLQYGDYMKLPPVEERFVHEFDAEWK